MFKHIHWTRIMMYFHIRSFNPMQSRDAVSPSMKMSIPQLISLSPHFNHNANCNFPTFRRPRKGSVLCSCGCSVGSTSNSAAPSVLSQPEWQKSTANRPQLVEKNITLSSAITSLHLCQESAGRRNSLMSFISIWRKKESEHWRVRLIIYVAYKLADAVLL